MLSLRTIRKETYSWSNEVAYDFDSYRTLLALVGHPLVFDANGGDAPSGSCLAIANRDAPVVRTLG